jgi:hypothetical protein
MSPYYLLCAEEKTWEARFKPFLDPSQWPVYEGQDYVSDVTMQNMRKGRRKKCFHNEMDNIEKSYDNDIYGSGDFDQMKNKVHYSVCHGEGHTMNRHKQGSERNPRACGAAGRNHRSGATAIIEVTHMNNIEKVFYLLVCTNIICCICN